MDDIAVVPATDPTVPLGSVGAVARFPTAASWALICAAVILLGLGFFQALEKKMTSKVTWGPGADAESMAIAISDLVYHLDQGYLAYAKIYDLFQSRLWQGVDEAVGEARAADADYLNAVIQDATQLDLPKVTPALNPHDFTPLANHQLIPVVAEDLGRVDYYKLAFLLFGYNIQAMHYLFFTILAISVGLFCWAFYRDGRALALLVVVLVAFNLEIAGALFSPLLPSISAYRGISALAIVPVLHLALAAWDRTPWRCRGTVIGLGQAAVFVFALWARSSAEWGVVAIILVTVLRWWQARGEIGRWRILLGWPLVIAVTAPIAISVYVHRAASPAYFTQALLPHHFVWHSAYLGLAYHPAWDGIPISDRTAFEPAINYLSRVAPGTDFNHSPITNNYWLRLHDQTVRYLFFQFALAHPRYMLELYGWYKPDGYYTNYVGTMLPAVSGLPLLGWTATLIVLTGLALRFERCFRGLPWLVAITGLVAAAACLPNLWAYPATHVMSDSVWAVTIFLLTLVWVAAVMLIRLPWWLIQGLTDGGALRQPRFALQSRAAWARFRRPAVNIAAAVIVIVAGYRFVVRPLLAPPQIPIVAQQSVPQNLAAPQNSEQNREEDLRRLSDMRRLEEALAGYFKDHNRYPTAPTGTECGTAFNNVGGLSEVLAPTYIDNIPADPNPPSCPYNYQYWSDTKNYVIMVHLAGIDAQQYPDRWCIGAAAGSLPQLQDYRPCPPPEEQPP